MDNNFNVDLVGRGMGNFGGSPIPKDINRSTLASPFRSEPTAPPQPRKKPQQTRSRILVQSVKEACLMLLEKHKMSSLKATKIADVAGVCMGSLYQYYPNVDAIVTSIYDDVVEAAEAKMASSSDSKDSREILSKLHSDLARMDAKYGINYYETYYSRVI